MVSGKIANLKQGEHTITTVKKNTTGDVKQQPGRFVAGGITLKEASDALGVSVKSTERARAVLASGDKDLIDAVESGEVPVTVAARQVNPPAPKPTQNVDDIDCQRILKAWDKAGKGGQALFLKAIGVEV